MSLTSREHAILLGRLLPQGPVWAPSDENGAADAFDRLLTALAQEPARVGEAYDLILEELIPDNPLTDLDSWERIVGPPDEALSDPDRLARIRAILNGSTNQSLSELEDFAQAVAGNEDVRLFNRVGPRSATGSGTRCGDRLRTREWDFTALCEVMPSALGVAPDAFEAWTGFGSATPLVLDKISVPALVAVSAARKLRAAYAGSCMRVRRTDNTEQDIGFVGGLLDTAALLAFVGAGSGYVTTLYDQGISARDLTQTNPTLQPIIVNAGALVVTTGSGAGSKPTMTLNTGRTLQRADACGMTGAPALTMAARLGNSTNTGYPSFCRIAVNTFATTGGLFSLTGRDGVNAMYVETIGNGQAFNLGPSVATSASYVARAPAGGQINSYTLRQNGADCAGSGFGGSSTAVMNIANQRTAIGGGVGPSDATYRYAAGDINILMIFNAVLSGADLTALEAELAAHA